MATVYLAEDLKHGREVALKVLRPELAATMGPERFFREIQVAARLQHPHILPLHDSGEADGFLFFVMPYVIGESLRERLSRLGELPIPDVVRILSQVADALSYSHSQGVVHRDIKPDNVMLSGRHALVTDFGVAKAVSEASGRDGLTTAGVALGTPTYMAPEQATADPHLDHRVDIYAIGVLGYEMLAGRAPFEGLSPQQMLVAHVTEAPRPVRQLREACPPELEAVVMRCLAKRPADRWQSADELLAALEPLGASSGGVTPTQSRPTSAQSAVHASAASATTARRRWLPAALALAAGIIAVGSWAALRGGPTTSVTPYGSFAETRITTTGQVGTAAMSPDQRQLAYSERVCNGESDCSLHLKVQDVSGAGVATLATGSTWISDVQWSADGRWLVLSATFDRRFGVYAIPSLGGSLRFLGCCLAAPTARGDTVLISSAEVNDQTQLTMRYVTLRDGRTVDSVPFTKAVGKFGAGFELSRDRMLVVSPMGTEYLVAVQDRAGALRDSMRVAFVAMGDVGLTVANDGFWLVMPNTARDDRVTLAHFVVDDDGRIARVPDRSIGGIPRGSDLSLDPAAGTLTASYGPIESSVWAARRPATDAMTFPLRLLARSTTRISGSLSSDGQHVILMRNRPSDARIWDLSVQDFEDGAERPLGAFEGLVDWDFFPDSRRVLMLSADSSGSRTRVEILDVVTGNRVVQGTEPLTLNFSQTLPNNEGWVALVGFGEKLALRGSDIRADTAFSPPAGMFNIIEARPTRDGRASIIAGWSATSDTAIIGRLAFADGAYERLGAFPSEGVAGLFTLPNGDVLLQVWESASSHRFLLWQQRTGTWRDLGSGPRPEATYRFADDGLHTVVRETIQRSDVYTVRAPVLQDRP